MAKIDLDKLFETASLRQKMAKRELPLRQVMAQQIPFLRKRRTETSLGLERLAVNAANLWEEPEFAFAWQQACDPDAEVEEDWSPTFTLDEMLELFPGEPLTPSFSVPEDDKSRIDLACAIVARASEALSVPGEVAYRGAPAWVRAALIEDRLRPLVGLPVDLRRRVRFVEPSEAARFILNHHSALPERNPRGALYDLGLDVGGRLVAVMSVTTPTGARGIEESAHVVEVSRVASDSSVYGSASALVSKAIELLPLSTRYGTKRPGLLVTYSLLSELGTTYKALEDMGLRPVAFVPAKRSQAESSQRGKVSAKADVPKIRWEAGPEAGPADKTLLRLVRPYRKVVEGRKLEKKDLSDLNVERLADLQQAISGRRPRSRDRATLVASLLGSP